MSPEVDKGLGLFYHDCRYLGRYEVLLGFPRAAGAFPARCPMVDPIQAWSSGSVPFLVETMLGLEAHAFEGQLMVRPALLSSVDWIELCGYRMGPTSVDLRFTRKADGTVSVDVQKLDGALNVIKQ